MTFLPLLFLSFLFLSSRKTCSKLSLRFHKINYNDNPKDTFRSNCMINKYQKFPFVSFNDLMIYFKDLKVPKGKTHHLAESGVWKVIRFCTGVLVLAKTVWGSSDVCKNWKTDQFWPVQWWISLLNFQHPLLNARVSSLCPPVLYCSDEYLHVCVPASPTLMGPLVLVVLCETLSRTFRVKSWRGLWVAMVSHQVRQTGFHSEDFSRTLIGSCSDFWHIGHRNIWLRLCKHIG